MSLKTCLIILRQNSHEVPAGSQLVGGAAGQLKKVLAKMQRNAQSKRAIAGARRERAVCFAKVTTAVRQLDEMNQHNAALVEQTNAAIEQIEGQAVALDALVSIFKLAPARGGVAVVPFSHMKASAEQLFVSRPDNLARDRSAF